MVGRSAIGYRLQVTGYRLQVTGYRLQVTGYRLQVTGYRLQVTGYRLQVTGYRLQVTGYRLQVTGYRTEAVRATSLAPGPWPLAPGPWPLAPGFGSIVHGSVKVNVLPWPGVLSTQIRPPCASISLRQIDSPRPLPCFSPRRPWTWRNSSKISGSCSGAIPMPVSRTLIATY